MHVMNFAEGRTSVYVYVCERVDVCVVCQCVSCSLRFQRPSHL